MAMIFAAIIQLLQSLLMILLAPLLIGWIRQNRAWLNNKKGAGIAQPYREIRKLFYKIPVLSENASWLFRTVPYIYFGTFVLITAIVPVLSIHLPLAPVADVIALVGLFALARIGLALAAMDIGTAFGSLGARREMLVAFLAEPALLMVFFNFALISQSTALNTVVSNVVSQPLQISPSLAFALIAFVMVTLAENARLPIDNPTTHLELTMIHEAMILEYSGRHLALIEWGSDLKLLNYFAIGAALFLPWGITSDFSFFHLLVAMLIFFIKLLIAGSSLAILETISAKIRIFRVPEFLTMAFLLAILGVLTQLLVGT